MIPPGPAWLFCPADRPERFAKALAAADVVVLDLEDGVAAAHKDAARAALGDHADRLDPARTVIRVNPAGTAEHAADLDLLARFPAIPVMLAKTERPEDFSDLAGHPVIALCETAAGVVNAIRLARERSCAALMWGAEDLVASLGGSSSRDDDGRYRHVALDARSRVLLAAGAAGKPALDSVYLNIPDLAGLRDEARDAAAVGFAAKVCIHPTQVPVVRAAYRPDAARIDWATGVLAAAAESGGHGVLQWRGQMVDEPVLAQARAVLRAATHFAEVGS